MSIKRKFSICAIFLLFFLSGCVEKNNRTASYLEHAELQYEGNIQKENIMTALNDILTLPEEVLKNKRYKDYTGKVNQWDLPTLFCRHFLPDSKEKTITENFYSEVKSKEVQKKVKEILEKLRDSGE